MIFCGAWIQQSPKYALNRSGEEGWQTKTKINQTINTGLILVLNLMPGEIDDRSLTEHINWMTIIVIIVHVNGKLTLGLIVLKKAYIYMPVSF